MDYVYQTLRCNVDLLKLIQLVRWLCVAAAVPSHAVQGVTFTDSTGALLPGTCTWQFNLKFDLEVRSTGERQ